MKNFNGKAIYNPSGKAGEYSYWACNFFTGCSNGCDYCYCKKGILAKAMGGDVPILKKCFKNEEHALEVFAKELEANLPEIQKHGLFFSFTTDPMIDETYSLTLLATDMCVKHKVPVKVLTKSVKHTSAFIHYLQNWGESDSVKYIAIGFTLTGCDEREPNASTNAERIEAMRKLHDAGFKTWASIEPIIDLECSLKMIQETVGTCDLYKVGLMSGKKYDWRELRGLMLACAAMNGKFYFKDSFVKQAGIDRANLPGNCVGRDYNIFRK